MSISAHFVLPDCRRRIEIAQLSKARYGANIVSRRIGLDLKGGFL